MIEQLADPSVWAALVTLTLLEIVLGIDNIIFISIISGKLPSESQARARQLGLLGAVITRLLLLASIFWLAKLTAPLFTLLGQAISVRDLVLIGGGLFLLAKSTFEIHGSLEATEHGDAHVPKHISFASVIVQIMLLDIVFSLDSVITAIGMADVLWVMAAAVIIAVGVMLLFAGIISDFVHRHPTIKMLALSFLLLIGMALVGEGLDMHIPKGYIYFAMAFSFGVEVLNMRLRATPTRRVDPQREG